MNRFVKCSVKVNKDLIKRETIYKYGSITNYCKYAGISRYRYWQIVNEPHSSKDVECLIKLTKDLNLSIDTILM